MTKKERVLQIIELLKKEYPDAECTLEYDEPWKLLVEVRLAAQCTDARVNVVVADLYKQFPTAKALAQADVSMIEEIVKPCGLGKSKAKDISACIKILHEKYNDEVPCDFDALLSLPGVGRKSANLIMGDVFGKPAIVTETHCIRLANRMTEVQKIDAYTAYVSTALAVYFAERSTGEFHNKFITFIKPFLMNFFNFAFIKLIWAHSVYTAHKYITK